MLQTFYIDNLCTFFMIMKSDPCIAFFNRGNIMHMLLYTAEDIG